MWSFQYVTDQSSWPPLSTEIDKRPDEKFRQDFIGVPVTAGGERENKEQFPWLDPQGGVS